MPEAPDPHAAASARYSATGTSSARRWLSKAPSKPCSSSHRPSVLRRILRRCENATVTSSPSRVAFSQRRKLLRNTLGRWLDERQHTAAFDLQRRAEEVPVGEYLALAAALAPK